MNIFHQKNTEPKSFKISKIREEISEIRTFFFEGSLKSKPGQFAMIWLPGIDEKPFSVAGDFAGNFFFTICRRGNFTKQLFQKKVGELVGIRGPFGNGFKILSHKKIILVAGGYGIAPLFFTAKKHIENNSQVKIIVGARNKDLIFGQKFFQQIGVDFLITTDDGSAGEKGFPTEVLEKILEKEKIDLVQTCGPEKMMKALAEICLQKNVEAEVSIERFCKCGFGVCGQCVTSSGEKMCQVGPVVNSKKALTFQDFGKYYRGDLGEKIDW